MSVVLPLVQSGIPECLVEDLPLSLLLHRTGKGAAGTGCSSSPMPERNRGAQIEGVRAMANSHPRHPIRTLLSVHKIGPDPAPPPNPCS